MLVASRLVSGFALSGGLTIPICVTRPKGFACATADAFVFSGFDGQVTLDAAESTSWRTSKFHVQYLSTEKTNRALPDAPHNTIKDNQP
jgi:hypothetical protein